MFIVFFHFLAEISEPMDFAATEERIALASHLSDRVIFERSIIKVQLLIFHDISSSNDIDVAGCLSIDNSDESYWDRRNG